MKVVKHSVLYNLKNKLASISKSITCTGCKAELNAEYEDLKFRTIQDHNKNELYYRDLVYVTCPECENQIEITGLEDIIVKHIREKTGVGYFDR